MKFSEAMGYHQEFDIGPVLGADGAGNDQLLKSLPVFTFDTVKDASGADAPAGTSPISIGAYSGPMPPIDPAILAGYTKAKALGADDATIAGMMATVKAQGAAFVGFGCTVHFSDPDVPGEEDTIDITIGAEPVAHLAADIGIGGLREQAAA